MKIILYALNSKEDQNWRELKNLSSEIRGKRVSMLQAAQRKVWTGEDVIGINDDLGAISPLARLIDGNWVEEPY